MKHFLLWMMLLATSTGLLAQGTETFNNMPAAASGYAIRNWAGDGGINWTATDARTDQTINGRAIMIRNGGLTAAAIPNGIGNLSFKHQQFFSGSDPVLQVYVNDNLVGSVNPTTTVATATLNNINVAGTFKLEIRQITAGLRIAIDDVTWTATGGPCVAPAAQPTGLQFAGITTAGAGVSFTAASPAADKYLVTYSASATPSATPVNGTTYTPGQAIGNTTVAGYGATASAVLSGLAAGTNYHVYVYAANDLCTGGPLYLSANPLSGNFTTASVVPCTKPGAAPTLFTALPGSTAATVGFLAAAGADGYLIVLSAGAPVSGFTPQDGVTYTVGQTAGNGKIAYFNRQNTASLTNLTSSTTYHAAVYAVNAFDCSGGPLYSTANLTGSFATTILSGNIPAGYYDAIAGLTCAPLKTALSVRTNTNLSGNTLIFRSYNNLWDQYRISDVKPREVGTGSANVIWDIYSDNPNGPDPYNFTPGPVDQGGQQDNGSGGNAEGQLYNREHTVALSWFGSSGNTDPGPATDYLSVMPTDKFVNNLRGSFLYGEVSNPTTTTLNGSKVGPQSFSGISGTAFEPIDAYKGDLARAFLYFVTRYQSSMTGWPGDSFGAQAFDPTTYPSVDIPYLRMMIKWHLQDPVSDKERLRNDASYTYQGNRNPYIDLPELVTLVWNDNCGIALPVNLLYFKGAQRGNIAHLQWQLPAGDNALRFDVERSTNGQRFEPIGTVAANTSHLYNFDDAIDKIGGRRVYYRLKAYYPNKPADYSDIVSMHLSANTTFSVFPNPAQRKVNLDFGRNLFTGEVIVTNFTGQRVAAQKVSRVTGSIAIDLPMLATGRYTITLMDASGRVSPVVQSFQVVR